MSQGEIARYYEQFHVLHHKKYTKIIKKFKKKNYKYVIGIDNQYPFMKYLTNSNSFLDTL